MGADFYSHALIGQKLDKRKLNKEVTVPGCNHNNPKTAAFCSQCGKRAFVRTEQPVIDLESIPSFCTITSTDDEDIIIALNHHHVKSGSSRGGDNLGWRTLDPDAINEAKTRLKELLEPYGLWDESQFGLWTVLYCSY